MMEQRARLVRSAVLVALGMALQGCVVAAAAIPLMAGTTLIGTSDDRAKRRALAAEIEATRNAPRPLPGIAELVEEGRTEGRPAEAGELDPVRVALPDGTSFAIAFEDLAAAPGLSAPPAPPPPPAAYGALLSYVDEASRDGAGPGTRRSALLEAPGALKPITSRCSTGQPAVLIDLDPAGKLGGAAPRADRGLIGALAQLRAQGVAIFWISERSAGEAPAIREALRASGLDLSGRDELVLMRYPRDRKQTRRAAIGATRCVLAIVGDERRDFDELYAYLREPGFAQPLEAMIGRGWFLAPPPLQSTEN